MEYTIMEMSNGDKYRVLLPRDELVRVIDGGLVRGGLVTLNMGISKPGNPVAINPRQVTAIP